MISDSEGDEKANSISRNEAGNDDNAAWGFGEDLGPLDDFFSDDAIEPQEPQNKPLSQVQLKKAVAEHLPQIKLKKAVAEPLITPVMSNPLSAKRSRSHVESTPSVSIRHGSTIYIQAIASFHLRKFDGRVLIAPAYFLICQHIVHQEDISEQEKILRQFDLASKYGPCLDITRLERWERASLLVSSSTKNAHVNIASLLSQ